MYNPSTNWVEQIKFIVREMLNSKQFVLEGVVSSVDPTPPGKVKVLLEPYGIESGWLRCAMPYVGKQFGLVLPPPEEGTQVKVIFDMGDIKNGTVIGSLYGEDVAVPNIAKGAAGLVHKSGSSLLIMPDGTVTIKGKTNSQSW
jgi:phage baseplate assembly protein gpV